MINKFLLYILTLALVPQLTFAKTESNELAVHLLSYLSQDYGEAVKNGKIISQDEFDEQIEFVTEVKQIAERKNYPSPLLDIIHDLDRSIKAKEKVIKVSKLADTIKFQIIKTFNIVTEPKNLPDFAKAAKLYKTSCVQCHGAQGKGDGLAGKGLSPKPTNFRDLDRMRGISPFQAYNTISLGVDGTGMAGYNFLSEDDRWSLAFYISTFRYSEYNGPKKPSSVPMTDIASLTDIDLIKKYKVSNDNEVAFLASIRNNTSLPPSQQKTAEKYLKIAETKLSESFNLFKDQKNIEANNLALEAYLSGIEPIEGILKSNNQKLVVDIEKDMNTYRGLLKNQNSSEYSVQAQLNKIEGHLSQARTIVTKETTRYGTVFMSFGIVLREALEAGLVLLLLFSVLNRFEGRKLKRYVHAGWVSALFFGLVLYFVSEALFTISGRFVESLEAYVSLIAAAVLLYVGIWFHRHSNIEKWKQSIKDVVNDSIINGKTVTLFLIAFASVFREIFETLLFMKIMVLDGHSTMDISLGALVAMGLSATLIYGAIKYSMNLRLDPLFKFSTALILILSMIIFGKSLGAFQKVGLLQTTQLNLPRIDALGFNSTLEVLFGQLLVLLVIFIYFVLRKNPIWDRPTERSTNV
tara:strand:- start:1846 stop:3753 length:1908 start_codon:yes stop_codon:yes gene_type:complete